jgi:hypothetical protein
MSVIIETGEAKTDQAFGFVLTPEFAGREFNIWKSDAAKSFVKIGAVKPKNGRLDLVLSKDAIFSLTTTTGQRKGDESIGILNPSAFPIPYEDDFEGYAAEASPRYTQDQAGVFEVLPKGGGMALRQVIPAVGIEWHFHLNSEPATLIGDPDMTDYEAAVDVMLEAPGQTAVIYGRVSKVIQHQVQPPMGYWLRVGTDGHWTLGKNMDLLLLDKIDIDKTWPALRYSFSDHTKNARIFPYAEIMAIDKSILEALPGVAAFLAGDKDPKTLNLGVHFDGSFYLYRDFILGSGMCEFKTGVWNTLRIRCRGDRIMAYVNETPTGAVTDSTYPRGLAGFGCGWHTAWFDNLSIKL